MLKITPFVVSQCLYIVAIITEGFSKCARIKNHILNYIILFFLRTRPYSYYKLLFVEYVHNISTNSDLLYENEI